MQPHIDRYDTVFEIQTPSGEIRYVHEKPFAEWTVEDPGELREISPILRRCREKEVQLDQGQPILGNWEHVSSTLER